MASHRPLHTPRLTIFPADTARLETILSNPASFTLVTGLKVADGFCPYTGALQASLVKMRRATDRERPWLTPRFLLLRETAEVIGIANFKDVPIDHQIELGYSIAPAYQNRGFATEAVRSLVDHVLSFPQVRIVRAFTSPHASASTRVLEKCGFQRVAETLDSLEGLVWLWERSGSGK